MQNKDRGAAVITGTSTGIGRASALLLDELGFRVFAGVRKDTDAESLRQAASPRLIPVFIDVTDYDSVARAASTVTEALDGEGLTGLVNNAGIALGCPLEVFPWEDLLKQLNVNLVGQMAVIRAFLGLIRKRRGRVVNVGSVGGIQPLPFLGVYDASKAGLHALTESLRMELGMMGIHVSLVIPGHIATPIWKKGRWTKETLRARLSPEAATLYGSKLESFSETVRKMEKGGLPAEAVAKVVARALTSPRPKSRYVVGIDARLQSIMSRLVPDRVRDALVLKACGLK